MTSREEFGVVNNPEAVEKNSQATIRGMLVAGMSVDRFVGLSMWSFTTLLCPKLWA